MTESLARQIDESVAYIRELTPAAPRIAVVLGSGLGDFADSLDQRIAIPNSSIPHYPVSTVQGHRGHIVFGGSGKKRILAFQGRIHFYESANLDIVLYPIHVAQKLGIELLIVTNAAGGVNRTFRPGDLMLITDQINLTLEPYSFPLSRSTNVYDRSLNETARECAHDLGLDLKEGVYVGVKGPSYETASEVEMIHRIGGDAVGMSTVFEASLAAVLGVKVLGISCITNLATGIGGSKLSHEEVTEVGKQVRTQFAGLLTRIIAAV